MPWFRPNIAKLRSRRDIEEHYKAMLYGKRDKSGRFPIEDEQIRNEAFNALVAVIAPTDSALVDSLIRLMDDPREWKRGAQLLARIDPSRAVAAIRGCLNVFGMAVGSLKPVSGASIAPSS
ncbi:MAG: hypothetical protein DMG57_42515 [Acidobacteria bacterium]|nr:MAG: hypothetical protein DMG57_42515 [Acidobacteriota bacterium]